MTRSPLTTRVSAIALAGVGVLTLGTMFAVPASADTLPATNCVVNCVATFNTPSEVQSFAVPAGVTSLTATVSGGAGAQPPAFAKALGGPAASTGGVSTVDLGTTYAGQTLTVGVGDTGQGSYLQAGSTLLVVAGGGGGAGYVGRFDIEGQVTSTQPGGNGGAPSAPGVAAGSDAAVYGQPSVNGKGGTATGGAAGTGTKANGTAGGSTTTTTGVGSTLAAGGAGATSAQVDAEVAGSGGSGYTGGGGGGVTRFLDSDDNPTDVAGGGGGGSGFLATGLTATADPDGNTATGSVVITYSFSPTVTTTATTVHRGDTVPATITGLPANTAFSVTFDGSTVVSDTSDSSGNATESFVVGSAAASGHFPLGLVVGATTVATSDPVAVIVTLATTGGPNPEFPAALAALLILSGGALLVARRRRGFGSV